SGPTLNGATAAPSAVRAAISPVVTVVLPEPDDGAATTSPGAGAVTTRSRAAPCDRPAWGGRPTTSPSPGRRRRRAPAAHRARGSPRAACPGVPGEPGPPRPRPPSPT